MIVRLCWSVKTKSGEGPFGMESQVPVKDGVSAEDLDSMIDKEALLKFLHLEDIVDPASIKLITPEEFDAQFPDVEEVEDL